MPPTPPSTKSHLAGGQSLADTVAHSFYPHEIRHCAVPRLVYERRRPIQRLNAQVSWDGNQPDVAQCTSVILKIFTYAWL